jgi:hypothetical protein
MQLVATKHISKRLKKGAKIEATGSRARALIAIGLFKPATATSDRQTARPATRQPSLDPAE